MMNRAELFLESWKDAEKYHQEYAQKPDLVSHHYNKLLTHHMGLANGKEAKFRGRAKQVLRHFVKWQDAAKEHTEKHKKLPTMDDLAAQKPKAIKSWQHYKRHVAPKEKRYHKEMWLLKQETDQHQREKGKQK